MSYQERHVHEGPEPAEPDRGSPTGYAAVKYTAIVVIVMAILAFLAWIVVRFT